MPRNPMVSAFAITLAKNLLLVMCVKVRGLVEKLSAFGKLGNGQGIR